MPKVLIAYASRSGDTQTMADYIAEGIRFGGAEAKVVNANELKTADDLSSYDGFVFGSATYHGEMMQTMKTLLFLAEKLDLKGKPGGSFGAFGWSGEAPDRIFETMRNVFQMHMVSGPLRLKNINLGGGAKMAQDYGKEIAKALVG